MVLAFLLLCLIWGTTWSVIQVGLVGIPPFTGVALRFSIAGALLLALARARKIPLGRTRREVALWVANGLLAFTVSYGVVYWSEQWVPSGLTAVLFATYPLFVAILAHFALPAETLRRPEALGILLGFGGVATIFSGDFSALGGSQVATGALVMLLSPLASAAASVAVKRWGHGIHPFSITAVPMLLAGAVMGALALATERERGITWDGVSIAALLYLTLAGSALTFSLYYWLLSHWPAKRLALISYVIPVVAMLIGAFRGEPLTLRTLGGSALVVIGVSLAVRR